MNATVVGMVMACALGGGQGAEVPPPAQGFLPRWYEHYISKEEGAEGALILFQQKQYQAAIDELLLMLSHPFLPEKERFQDRDRRVRIHGTRMEYIRPYLYLGMSYYHLGDFEKADMYLNDPRCIEDTKRDRIGPAGRRSIYLKKIKTAQALAASMEQALEDAHDFLGAIRKKNDTEYSKRIHRLSALNQDMKGKDFEADWWMGRATTYLRRLKGLHLVLIRPNLPWLFPPPPGGPPIGPPVGPPRKAEGGRGGLVTVDFAPNVSSDLLDAVNEGKMEGDVALKAKKYGRAVEVLADALNLLLTMDLPPALLKKELQSLLNKARSGMRAGIKGLLAKAKSAKKLAKKLHYVQKILAFNPEHRAAKKLYKFLNAKVDKEVNRLYRLGMNHYAAEHLKKAIVIWKEAVEIRNASKRPPHRRLKINLARAQRKFKLLFP